MVFSCKGILETPKGTASASPIAGCFCLEELAAAAFPRAAGRGGKGVERDVTLHHVGRSECLSELCRRIWEMTSRSCKCSRNVDLGVSEFQEWRSATSKGGRPGQPPASEPQVLYPESDLGILAMGGPPYFWECPGWMEHGRLLSDNGPLSC